MWEVVRTLVDPRTSRVWASHYQRPRRVALGLHRIPETAVVGLVAGRYDEVDPVDEVVRRCEFQRACLRLARARVDVASGPVGDHGVVFLAPAERSDQATRAKLVELGERAVVLARRQFALRLHVGTSTATGSASLPVRYQAALAAAEKALSQGVRLVHASALTGPAEHAVRDLRAELARAVDEPTSKLTARFDRYLDIVAVHSGYRMEPTRVHLDAGFERLASPFVVSGALDQETFDDLCGVLDRAAESASTLRDLFFAYRTAVADLVQALDRPTRARRERSLRRAVQFIREHVAEPIRLKAVARVAGFEPHYFSRLFRERENVTFEKFVTERRIERAKQMLWRTSLGIERIGQLSGFASSTYFHRVFKRVVGETPLEYRKRPT
jgi:AraC-like DNA-binding protein